MLRDRLLAWYDANARDLPWRVGPADHALGDVFGAGFDQLLTLGADQRVALMCAEAMWWRCHRRIIADYLVLNGHRVDHLMTPGRTTVATPTPGSVRRDDGKVVYPEPTEEARFSPSGRS